jgi:hypothetical protein
MVMSAAALAGIRDNGHGWKYDISLGGLTATIGAMGYNTPDSEVEQCAVRIAEAIRRFATIIHRRDERLATVLDDEANEIEYVADCGLDEVRERLSAMYDTFDYERICVVG